MSEGTQLYKLPVIEAGERVVFNMRGKGESPFSVTCKCGHPQWDVEELLVGDKVVRTSKPNFSAGYQRMPGWLQWWLAPKQCFTCRFGEELEHAILCFQCRDVIFRGDPVCTLRPIPITDKEKQQGTLTPSGYIGCMGWNCCPSGLFFAGHWVGDGVLTPYQSGNLATAAFSGEVGGEDGIIVQNFGPLEE